MNGKERERLKVMDRLKEGTLKQKVAAKQLGLSTRQVKRLYKAYLTLGDKGIVSRQRGKPSNHSLSNLDKNKIIETIKELYSDFGPTLAHEKITEIHKFSISVSSVRQLMIKHNIWQTSRQTVQKIHRLRDRRECFGALVQMDGSYHDWFEGRLPKCCLLVLIDDATSELLHLQFVDWETCWSYFQFLKTYLQASGRPVELYTDRHAIFETTRKTEKNYKDTQFHRAMEELGIRLILAHSPEAKGRVERVNGTLQDRLVKEMRLAGISSMEEANNFLPHFIHKFNKKFGKKPKSSINAHRPLDENYKLDRILCLQSERKITKDLMVYYNGKRFQITDSNCHHRLGGNRVTVLEKEGEIVEFLYKGHSLSSIDIDKEPSKVQPLPINPNEYKERKPYVVRKDHPWKTMSIG